jgi:hypothetical protein
VFYRFQTARLAACGDTFATRFEWSAHSKDHDVLVNLGVILYAAPLNPSEEMGAIDNGHNRVTCLHMVGGNILRVWMPLDDLQRLLVEHARLIED